MPVVFMGIVLSTPTTDYANSGGTGNRTATITVTTNITPDGGTINNLVDGAKASNNSDGIDMPGVGATAIPDGTYVKFDFGVGVLKYIDEVKLYFEAANPPNMGAWIVQCSNDDSNYTTVGSYTWNTATQTITLSGVDVEGFRYWKLAKNGAGTNYTNSFWQEVEFKIAAGAS
jgi:hypothetical protein